MTHDTFRLMFLLNFLHFDASAPDFRLDSRTKEQPDHYFQVHYKWVKIYEAIYVSVLIAMVIIFCFLYKQIGPWKEIC